MTEPTGYLAVAAEIHEVNKELETLISWVSANNPLPAGDINPVGYFITEARTSLTRAIHEAELVAEVYEDAKPH